MGAYHTLDLELHSKFTLAKSHWDSVALDRISSFIYLNKKYRYRIYNNVLCIEYNNDNGSNYWVFSVTIIIFITSVKENEL